MEIKKIPQWKFFVSILFPFLSLLIEIEFYHIFTPTVWFLFYPSIFLASWFGGLWAGIISTINSVALVNWFLIEPLYSFKMNGVGHLIITLTFTLMGISISYIHHRYKKQVEHNLLTNDQLEKIKLQGQQLQLAVESAQLGIWSWDIIQDKLAWSDNMYQLFGIKIRKPLEFKSFISVVHPDDREATLAVVQKSIEEGSYYECEYRVVWPDGSLHWVVGVGRSYKNEIGKTTKMQGIVRNIESRKQLEFELREEKERFAEAQRIASIASWRLDLEGHFKYSHEFFSIIGLKRELNEKVDNIISRLVYPEDQPALDLWFKNCLAGQRPSTIVVRRYFVDGQFHYLSVTGELQHDNSGAPVSILGTIQDVTELHLKDEALRIVEERHRFALESLRSGEWELDIVTLNTVTNKRYDEIFGYVDNKLPWTFDRFISHIHPEDRKFAEENFKNAAMSFECRIQRTDKKMRWIQVAGERKKTVDGRDVMVGIVKDISDRKESEIRIVESEARFRSLFEYLPIAYQALDIQGQLLDANNYMAELLGYKDSKDLLGRKFADFFDLAHQKELNVKIEEMQQINRVTGEIFLKKVDGSPLTVDVASRNQFDNEGNFIRSHYIVIDVTERRNFESRIRQLNIDLEKKVEERTRQLASANSSKSLFLANMSHEIRTPLNAVLGLTQLLAEENLNPDQKDMIHKISLSGKSLLSIVDDILDFSKIEAGQLELFKKVFSLEELLSQVRSIIDVSAKAKGLNLIIENQNRLTGKFLGDSQRIGQILLNLTGNAVKFTHQGSIIVRVISLHTNENSSTMRFEIEDTGIGIKPEVLDTLFKPFIQADNTITRRFGGTGLGLSISKKLVDLMGGKIGVSSVFEKGSTFWFELTLERLLSDTLVPDSIEVKLSDWKEKLKGFHLLVVDDSQDNLFLADRVLKKVGAQVSLVENGEQACVLLKSKPNDFDVVLMDIEMPVMDGLAATRAIRKDLKLTHLPIIALSAGVFAEEKQRAIEAGMNDFLSKPMDLKIMIEMINKYCKVKPSQIDRPRDLT